MPQSKKAAGAGLKPPEKGALNAQELTYCSPSAAVGYEMATKFRAIATFIVGFGQLLEDLTKNLAQGVEAPAAAIETTKTECGAIAATECVYSRFRGKTLRHKRNGWIRVENDGVTFTCPTKVGDDIIARSYTMPNKPQIDFMDNLLAAFKADRWFKPSVNKSKWQNTCFNRGDSVQFLKDRHIDPWMKGQKGGCRGSIRLAVAHGRQITPENQSLDASKLAA